MSTTRTVETEFRDPVVMEMTAKELNAAFKVGETVDGAIRPFRAEMYGNEVQAVMTVHLEGWKFPVAVDKEGIAHYDNHNGHWGKDSQLDQLRQGYAVNFVRQRAAQQGLRVTSQQAQADGTVRLVLA